MNCSTHRALYEIEIRDFSLFERHQAKLRQLYLEKDKSLKHVKEEMETYHEFPETDAKIYEYGLRHLGFVKKLGIEQWIQVDIYVKKKERKGKETKVFLSGVLQPPDKINRVISRHKRRRFLQDQIGRASTPACPEGVLLRTLPSSPNMAIIDVRRNARQIPMASQEVHIINRETGDSINFEDLSGRVWPHLISNPRSIVHLLPHVPSSQAVLVFGQFAFRGQEVPQTNSFNFMWDSAFKVPACQYFLEALSKASIMLANGWEARKIPDLERLLAWVGADTNKSALKGFFTSDLPAVVASWALLMGCSAVRSGNAFQNLVEVGFATHNGEWIQQHAETLINGTATLGFRNTRRIVRRLLSSEPTVDRRQWINALGTIGLDFHLQVRDRDVVRTVFKNFDPKYDLNFRFISNMPFHLLDYIWFSGKYDVYEAILSCTGLIIAARSGPGQLLLYLNLASAEAGKDQSILLETALSLAAGSGDIAAIRSFGEANVDPNARMLLSATRERYRVDFHPLMRAAGGKHLDAVRLLIEMGCELTSEIQFFNPLSAAIWTPEPISDTKRNRRLGIVEYFLGKNLACVYGRDAMIKAVVPPYELNEKYFEVIMADDFVPDEEVIDMLTEAGIVLNEITENGRDLLHFAIDRSCNLRTVEILVSRGAQLHSRPCLRDGKTMLHSAAASYSKDRQKIVELLLQSGADCATEYGRRITILEPALCVEGRWRQATSLRLFSLLLEHGAQLNGPTERPLEKASDYRCAPVLIRPLDLDAPDALIHETIQAGADINSLRCCDLWDCCYNTLWTPLQYAIRQGRLDIARQLIARGVDINSPAHGEDGYTALQAACRARYGDGISVGFIRFLLDNGADINAAGAQDGGTALQCAVEAGSIGAFCLLLDAGANIFGTVELSTGKTSTLRTAAEHGRLDMVDMILKKLAGNTKCGRHLYEDAVEWAERYGHFAIAKMIRAAYNWTSVKSKTCQVHKGKYTNM
ncbi:ankyrin [Xylaria sp. FL1042]|nr:ankyrin [Xylaria sp. FL1042]